MRYHEIYETSIAEATSGSYRVFHGSDYEAIGAFRFDNLRHRTGTPGTLSFTTNFDTAKIYGKAVYEVEVSGRFGDYLDPADVEANFRTRWPQEKSRLEALQPRYPNYVPDFDKSSARMHAEIERGDYALWENVLLWEELGWDGAWTFEHGARNLIVSDQATIKIINVIRPPRDD